MTPARHIQVFHFPNTIPHFSAFCNDMAALSSRRPEKRSLPLSSGDTEEPPSKQQKRTVHQHRVRYKQDVGPNRILHDDEAHFLLTRSVALALTVAGFDGAEPVAIESFRAEVEECMSRFRSLR